MVAEFETATGGKVPRALLEMWSLTDGMGESGFQLESAGCGLSGDGWVEEEEIDSLLSALNARRDNGNVPQGSDWEVLWGCDFDPRRCITLFSGDLDYCPDFYVICDESSEFYGHVFRDGSNFCHESEILKWTTETLLSHLALTECVFCGMEDYGDRPALNEVVGAPILKTFESTDLFSELYEELSL